MKNHGKKIDLIGIDNSKPMISIARNKNKTRKIKIPKREWLKNYLDATKLKDIDLIVELIGGAEGPEKKLVFAALKNKKNVKFY